MWQDATKKEMQQIIDFKTFEPKGRGAKVPSGYTYVPVHLCFDVKFDLRRKAVLVADGHRTEDPNEDELSGFITLDVVSTCFFLAELNNIGILAADVVNFYINGHTKE